MKKRVLVLAIIACILGLTACGSEERTQNEYMTKDYAIESAESIVESLNQIYAQNAVDQYADYPAVVDAVASWGSAMESMGEYQGIISSDATVEDEAITVEVTLQGSERNATQKVVFTKDQLSSMSTLPVYTMGELMEKAGLNTLLGMGTVFVVLILISFIISGFSLISKVQDSFTKKGKKEDIKAEAVDNTIAQIAEKEELSDDYELVAVISAAIAASEGATSTDGYVVRSIRKANKNKWQNA